MTEYEKWKLHKDSFGAVHELPLEVQELMNSVPVAFKKAAVDAGIVLLDDMTGPVVKHGDIELKAHTRKLQSSHDFYSQFLTEFTTVKERGLKAVAYYACDVIQYGGGNIDPTTFKVIEGPTGEPRFEYIVRYATVME